ncbi:MAG: flagellar filament capping protein FliD [Oligoflexales bacterium]
MGIRGPGSTTGLFDPKVVEKLIDLEKIPVENAKMRKEQYVEEQDEFSKINEMVNGLDSAVNSLKSKADFYRMKVESSHPDILDGTVQGIALTGSYEFEVRGLAKNEKELAYGFPDKDQTAVGFGYMLVERDDKEAFELTVEPGSTLQDVANQINDADLGVKAMIINTKYKPDAYRLLVVSETSGNEAKITIDEDTTFLEFKEQVTGRNLDILFEDVPVTDEDNNLEELVDGVVFNAKRSEPGTRVQVNVVHDVDATLEGIKTFVDKYNELSKFINDQFKVDEKTKKAGVLASDGSIKSIQRQLQGVIGTSTNSGGKFNTLAEVGITTDPKTGMLNYDEAKVRGALAEDYDSVAALFIRGKDVEGIASKLGEKIKQIKDPQGGVLKSRMRSLDRIIKNQDKVIEQREMRAQQREEAIKRRFSALESQLSGLKSQGDFLSQRFGSQGGGKGAG